jgi:hypothetical protein
MFFIRRKTIAEVTANYQNAQKKFDEFNADLVKVEAFKKVNLCLIS